MSLNNYQKTRVVASNGRRPSSYRYTTDKGKEYQSMINYYLTKQHKDIYPWFEKHTDHVFEVEIIAYFSDLFTKKNGDINSKVPDADNIAKPVLDCIEEHIQRNDRYNNDVLSRRRYGDNDSFTVSFKSLGSVSSFKDETHIT